MAGLAAASDTQYSLRQLSHYQMFSWVPMGTAAKGLTKMHNSPLSSPILHITPPSLKSTIHPSR
jgi:hypothetical protein